MHARDSSNLTEASIEASRFERAEPPAALRSDLSFQLAAFPESQTLYFANLMQSSTDPHTAVIRDR
jgi:hypothetical protein